MRRIAVLGLLLALLSVAREAHAQHTPQGRRRAAAWLSVAHPGLGEWYNRGWGGFFDACPQKKFWLGFIPLYGWPYLSIRSAIDASDCKTLDRAY